MFSIQALSNNSALKQQLKPYQNLHKATVIPFRGLTSDQICFTGSKKNKSNPEIEIGKEKNIGFPDISKKEYNRELEKLQSRLVLLQQRAREQGLEVIMVFEGWDAAGKGGTIKRVTEKLDPRGVKVFAIGAPTKDELNHHYLWRFWNKLQGNGVFTMFDRSWYGRVMVERVEEFATPKEWKKAYKEINEFERTLTDNGAMIFKFFLDISKDEQLKRFESRRDDPFRSWKLTDEDWRNRDKWDEYRESIEDMYQKTNKNNASWHIIPSNSKKYARIEVLKTITEALEQRLEVDPKSFYPESIR
jgi:polyphosphate kinase 2 (PPK2 family)